MKWWEILKVDNIINDPTFAGQAWYNPEDDTVNMNIGHPAWAAITDEDELIDALEEMITHEYAHKAMSSETYPIQQQNLEEMKNSFFEYVLQNDDSAARRFMRASFNFAESLAAEETYAYLTGTIGGAKPRDNLPRISGSTFQAGDSIMSQIMDIIQEHGRQVLENAREEEGAEFSATLARYLQARIKTLLSLFARQTAQKAKDLNMAYMNFIQKAKNMSDYETDRGKAQLLENILNLMHARIPE